MVDFGKDLRAFCEPIFVPELLPEGFEFSQVIAAALLKEVADVLIKGRDGSGAGRHGVCFKGWFTRGYEI